MEQNEFNKLWNCAVHNVGGATNTQENFDKVAQDFLRVAKQNGAEEQESRDYVHESEAAVCDFFVR